MKKSFLQKIFAVVLAISLSVSPLMTTVKAQEPAKSPLVISEIVPDTDNVSGSDAYEFFELKNVSNQSINMNDYILYYNNKDIWTLNEEIVLEPQEVLVVWILNGKNDKLTASDFNAYWGSELTQGDNLATINSGGFANGSQRDLEIYTKTWQLLNSVRYNHDDVKLVVKDGGIKYKYTGATSSEIISYDTKGSAGILEDNQIETSNYEFAGLKGELKVVAENLVKFNNNWQYKISLDSDNLILAGQLKIVGENKTTISYPLSYVNGELIAEVPFQDVSGFKNFKAQAVLFDGVADTLTEELNVKVEQGEFDKTNVPSLIITELIPDTSNVNSADAYEYIEVTNNSDAKNNFKDYQLLYNYPDDGPDSNVLWFQTREDLFVDPGASLVFWVKNGYNDELTVDDFNNHFNSNLTLNENIFEIFVGGMANGGPRGMYVKSNVGDVYSYVQYNMDGKEVTADRSIVYQYNTTTEAVEKVSNDALPTPGFVPEDIRSINSEYQAPQSEISVVDHTESSFDNDKGLTFAIEVSSDSEAIKTVELFIKDNTSTEFEAINVERSKDNPAVFSYSLDAIDLTGKDYYDYYYVLSDGTQEIKLEEKRVESKNKNNDGIRFNLESEKYVNNSVFVSTTGDSLYLGDKDITDKTHKSLNSEAKFVFETSQTDAFFKNAVAIGNDVIGVFDEGTYANWRTYTFDVPLAAIKPGETLQVDMHAGNKANVLEHNEENNDDFTVRNIRLILPNGYTLRAEGFEDPNKIILMGDSAGKIEILEAKFTLTDEMYNAIGTLIDTTELEDGTYELSSGKKDSAELTKINLHVDNNGPEININIEDNEEIRGEKDLEVSLTDKGIGLDEEKTRIYLDGNLVELPLTFDSTKDEAKSHTLKIVAQDKLGNEEVKEINFTIPEEQPTINNVSAKVVDNQIEFTIEGKDLQNDTMKAQIKLSKNYNLESPEVSIEKGRSNQAAVAEDKFAEEDINGLPYEVFTLDAGENLNADDSLRINWVGETNNTKTFLYALNPETNSWDKLNAKMSKISESEVRLEATVAASTYANAENKVQVMVQNGEGFTPEQFEAGAPANQPTLAHITTSHADDTDRNAYDFTFAWESDTQYYNEDYVGNPNIVGKYQYQLDIHDWLIANRPRLNLQYLFHTGDIIDNADEIGQWTNADDAYKLLDGARLPYGVLAGNHDVDHLSNDYTNYGKYFGDFRFENKEHFAGSYKNNRGHYDLITVDGIDFIMMYMGWNINEAEINWMNNVLAKYPERVAILNFHEYLLASGGLGEQPQAIYNQVVKKNHNVKMIFSGHYHNAVTVPIELDDNGDGVNDRVVYQMLFDYQGLKEGGMGYIRLMHFDNDSKSIKVRTYSPSLDDYNAKDYPGINGEGIKGEETFTIPYADININPERKVLKTNSLDLSVDTNTVLAEVAELKSGEVATVKADIPEGAESISWFLELTDPYGAVEKSPVYVTNVESGETEMPEEPGDGEVTEPSDPSEPSEPSDPSEPENPIDPENPGDDSDNTNEEDVEKFKLVFALNEGTWADGSTEDKVIVADKGSIIEIPAAPVRDGYTFDYWKGSKYYPGDKYKVEEDHTFTAQWKLAENTDNTTKSPDNTTENNQKDKPEATKTGQSEYMLFVGGLMLLFAVALVARKKEDFEA